MNNQKVTQTPPSSPVLQKPVKKQFTPEFERVLKDMREQKLDDKMDTKHMQKARNSKFRANIG